MAFGDIPMQRWRIRLRLATSIPRWLPSTQRPPAASISRRCGLRAYNGGWIETNEETGLSEFHEDIDYDARAFELRDSDIVCFLQGEKDDKSGFTALIHEPRPNDVDDIYHLPPYATVTLISIEEPGEWELELELDDEDAPPLQAPRLQRRLYTVTVSYGI